MSTSWSRPQIIVEGREGLASWGAPAQLPTESLATAFNARLYRISPSNFSVSKQRCGALIFFSMLCRALKRLGLGVVFPSSVTKVSQLPTVPGIMDLISRQLL